MQECDVCREDLLNAAKRNPARCFVYSFAPNGTRITTHIAYTPDGAGFWPSAPTSATADFGVQRDPATARRQQ